MDSNNNNGNNNITQKRTFSEAWKLLTPGTKALMIAGFIVSAAVIILALLSIFGAIPNGGLFYVPLMGVLMLLQAAQNWKTRRGLAYFSIAAAVFVFVCWIWGLAVLSK